MKYNFTGNCENGKATRSYLASLLLGRLLLRPETGKHKCFNVHFFLLNYVAIIPELWDIAYFILKNILPRVPVDQDDRGDLPPVRRLLCEGDARLERA